jgi:hypothetical protein
VSLGRAGPFRLAVGKNRKWRRCFLLLDFRQICLRKGKDQRNWLDLRDNDGTVRVGGMDDIADVDLPDARYAIDR